MRAEAGLPFTSVLVRPRRSGAGAGVQFFAFIALIVLLPIFLQSFQYMLELPLFWTVSKASPVLLLPLALVALIVLRLPYLPLFIVLFAYLMLVGPVMSMLHLENNFPEALGTTVKIWSFTFYFSIIGALMLLRVTEETLARAFLTLATLNFAILWGLWIILPIETYGTNIDATSMFFWDLERGPRIMLPLAFGIIGILWLARRFAVRPAIWPLALILLGFVLMVTIYKQRTAIAALLLLVLWGLSSGFRRRMPLLFWGLVLAGIGAIGLAMPLGTGLSDSPVRESLGGSLSVREDTARSLINFLSQNPIRWVFGIGGTTDYSEVSFRHIFRTRYFFLSDVGWLGVLGEYGVVGAGLIAFVYITSLREARRAAAESRTPLRLALQDYVLYLLLTSLIYSVIYTPGQVVSVLGIAVYLQALGRPATRPAAAPRLFRRDLLALR